MSKKQSTKILVQCALFLAIGLVLRNFSQTLPIGGGGAIRVGVSGIFTKMPAVLFGAGPGAVVSALFDFFGYVLKPEGAYIFPLTFTAAVGSAMTGIIFKFLSGKSAKAINRVYIVFVALTGIFGVFNHVAAAAMPGSLWGSIVNSFGNKTIYLTYGMYAICVIGAVLYIINALLKRHMGENFTDDYIHLFTTLLISDVFVTTINTPILMAFIPPLGKLPFWSVYLPRLLQEFASVFILSFCMTYLLKLYKRTFR